MLKLAVVPLSLFVAGLAVAQPAIVPPPKMPGQEAVGQLLELPVRPAAPAAAAPKIAEPATTPSGVIPPAKVGAGDVLNMPAAPQAAGTALDLADLIPVAPEAPAAPKKAKTAKTKKASRAADHDSEVSVAVEQDPFAGVVRIPVSDSQLNRFVFPESIKGVYFAEGAPLPDCPPDAGDGDPCRPIFLNNQRMMLLQLRAGAKGLFQALVHLASGNVVTLNLVPGPGPGAVVRVDGAEDSASDERHAAAASARQGGGGDMTVQDVALLQQFASGKIPAYFTPRWIPAPTRRDTFDIVPMASWTDDSGRVVTLSQIRPHTKTPVQVSNDMFQSDRVLAVALDSNVATQTAPAYLYQLESE